MEFMGDKMVKVYPECSLDRKGTRDTDNYSQMGSCHQNPPKKQQQQPTNGYINATEHVLSDAAYCRVCLQVHQDSNPLLSVCQCRDLIHEQCLLEWVQHRIEGSDDRRLRCEICKQAYSVVFLPHLSFTCEIAKQKNRKYRKDFAHALLVFLAVLAFFLTDVVLLLKTAMQEEFSAALDSLLALPKNTVIAILVMALIFLGVFALGLGYRLMVGFCYGTRWRLGARAG